MATHPTKITGAESGAGDGTPLGALIAFYRAFNAKNIEALAANWAQDDMPSMDNPIGGIRRGWPAIRGGYANLFDGRATVQVAFQEFSSQGANDWHLFVGREQGICQTSNGRLELSFRTSRLFIRTGGLWRQLHHHGSAEEPAMLADYQKAIFGAPLSSAA